MLTNMANTLKIVTWNATGIMSSASYLCDLLQKYSTCIDICGLSEHWLFNHNKSFLSSISNEYIAHVKCHSDLLLPGNRKVGKGGVAILWHNSMSNLVTPLDIDNDRIIGIQLQVAPGAYMFLS